MRYLKINTRKVAVIVISVLVLNTACTSNKKSENTSTQTKVETKVKPPKMDLSTAAAMGNMEAVKQHIAQGADLNVQEPNVRSTPLITAAFFGHTKVALALIKAGADLNIQNNEGSTALHTAAFFCRPEIIEALVAVNADKTLKNIYNSTAYESVAGPFEHVKPIYEKLQKDLKPIGLILDLAYIEKTRTEIAEMLK